ncbi:MAG: hypothetical protein RI897_2138 [Verrucomicrobiota bacterium]|jgi:formylglycine-generating enzyme required for sulfatase activity
MGSPTSEPDRDTDELQHEVVLTHGFFMAELECSQAIYQSITGNNPAAHKGTNRPVENVTWEDATTFCKLLTAQHQQEGILPQGWEWRLPTEAQWEYACRAGTTTARYGELEATAWYELNSGGSAHPSAERQPNTWGLHDMYGNLGEWCSDFYDAYPTDTATNPAGPPTGHYRVLRGMSWYHPGSRCRSAFRYWILPTFKFNDLGFRPLLSPSQ